ncbi:hypothetical protein G647_01094 [Cladophialophora carrionii CBS 160.54]|uniref:Uncharacterized protein n=1 Tax=Cladophialophora carrionii CBS 160.54 TaxID=1279043 RepID=V9DQQ2_9EURO|nr:uncharacterized protein G647_01094 [Cladophialophora carrionii CBS 160.54]ETI28643.1 hypothetical protein G647_01094 [Cladophialophora carrionii CBS 160.54]
MTPTQPTESQILHSYLLHPSPLPTILPYTAFLALLPKHPSSLQTTHATELKRLYRDLEFQRAVIVDDVRRRIESECTKSISLTARLARQVRWEENLKQQRQRQRQRKRKRKRGPEHEHEHDHEDTYTSDDECTDTDTNTRSHLDIDIDIDIQADTALHDGVPLSNTLIQQPTGPSKHKHSLYHDGPSLLLAMDKATRDLDSEIADLEAEIDDLRSACQSTVGGLSDLRYGRFGRARGSGNGVDDVGIGNGNGSEDAVADEVLAALDEFKAMLAGT